MKRLFGRQKRTTCALEARLSGYRDSSATARNDITIRPAAAGDGEPLYAMHQRLSRQTLYNRYLQVHTPMRSELADGCQLNADDGVALVATIKMPHERIVGLAYYVVDHTRRHTAEFAMVVEDRFQNQGIGRRLFQQLARQARSQHVAHFDAAVTEQARHSVIDGTEALIESGHHREAMLSILWNRSLCQIAIDYDAPLDERQRYGRQYQQLMQSLGLATPDDHVERADLAQRTFDHIRVVAAAIMDKNPAISA